MARKFGKKNKVSANIWSYNIGLLGESGIGKSTIIFKMLDKLVGDDGYIMLDIGKEDGHEALNGVVTHKVENFDKLLEFWEDVYKNRDTDYKDLKVIAYDTLDEFISIVEPHIVDEYNKAQKKKGKETADSINAAHGGFQRGQDEVMELILHWLWKLKKVGISFILIMHTKTRELTDPVSELSYNILSSKITQRYFNEIKTKLHFLGVACHDRTITPKLTGKKDIKGKDIKIKRIEDERRIIKFRDDNYSVDSKSRFADIVDEVPMDVDMLIKAFKDAIQAEIGEDRKSNKTFDEMAKEDEDNKKREVEKEIDKQKKEEKEREEKEKKVNDIKTTIKDISSDDSKKTELIKLMKKHNIKSALDIVNNIVSGNEELEKELKEI